MHVGLGVKGEGVFLGVFDTFSVPATGSFILHPLVPRPSSLELEDLRRRQSRQFALREHISCVLVMTDLVLSNGLEVLTQKITPQVRQWQRAIVQTGRVIYRNRDIELT